MAEIRAKMHGAEAVEKRLEKIAGRCGSLRPVMRAIGDRVVRQTWQRFNQGGPAPDGTPWAPLKSATLRQKKHRKILTESGHLRGSIRYRVLGRTAVAIGTNKVYGAIHQFGGTITQGARSELFVRNRYTRGAKKGQFKKGTAEGRGFTFGNRSIAIPARSYLGLSRANSDEVIGIMNNYIMGR